MLFMHSCTTWDDVQGGATNKINSLQRKILKETQKPSILVIGGTLRKGKFSVCLLSQHQR